MNQTTTDRNATPAGPELDAKVLAFRAQFDDRSPLGQLVREGARRMLQSAVDAEVQAFIAQHADRRDQDGRRLVVKNGDLPARDILTGVGSLEVKQWRVRDNAPDSDARVQFAPSILPIYLCCTDAIEGLVP